MSNPTSRGIARLLRAMHDPGSANDGQLLAQFLGRRDETAFAALVERHGPMVLGVCRRLLGSEADAEDAFQATFLVLVRKAGSLTGRPVLGDWLHGVARRTALNARRLAARRRQKEQTMARPEATGGEVRDDWLALLDEELSRLPEKYRLPIVLCDLEGRGRQEAAERLGWPEGTVAGRLARGRAMLAKKLARQGVALSAGTLAALVCQEAARAVMPPALATATVKAAGLLAAGQAAAAGAISAEVSSLTEGVVKAMFLSKLKTTLAVALIIVGTVALASGMMVAGQQDGRSKDEPPPKAEGLPGVDPLPAGARMRLGTMRLRHEALVTRVTFTPDGRGLISSSLDGTARLWDVASGREIRRFPDSDGGKGAVALSPDGKVLLADDRLWHVATGGPLPPLAVAAEPPPVDPDGFPVRGLVGGPTHLTEGGAIFTADSRTLVLRSFTSVDSFDVASGKRLRHTPLPPPPQKTKLADGYVSKLSPDGKHVAVARADPGVDSVLAVYDTATGKEIARMGRDHERIVHFTFAPDGKTVAAVMGPFINGNPQYNSPIRLWDVSTGKNTVTFEPGGMFYSVLFSPDGKVLAANRYHPNRELLLWDLQTGKKLAGLSGVDAKTFSPDGKAVAGAWGNTVRLWEVPSGKEVHPFAGHRVGLLSVACAPDGRTIATDDKDGHVCLWQADTGRLLHAAQTHLPYQYHGVFSPDVRTLAAGGPDSTVRLWDVATGREVRSITMTTAGGGGWAQAFSPDGRTLAAGCAEGDDSAMGLWDVASGRQIRRLPWHKMRDSCAVFSPDGRTLAASSQDDMIRLWDVASGRLLRQWACPWWSTTMAFSPDGRCLATAQSGYPDVHVWEAATGLERCRLAVDPQGVCAVAFAPNGRRLACAGGDGAARLWSWPAVRGGGCLPGHAGKPTPLSTRGSSGGVAALAFTPDSRGLVTGGDDAVVLVWDLTPPASEPQPAAKELSEEEMQRLWADLAGDDGHRVHATIAALATAGDSAVLFLAKRLKPEAPIDVQRVQRLLADLEGDEFAAREKATQELQTLGERLEPTLRKALAAGPRPESRRRLEQVLNGMEQGRLPHLRAVEALESVGTPAAREVLRTLAKGAPDASLTRAAEAALLRLTRR
jgi:RNA polymerase sigma factor (sigma-70 family)